jgi:hypothetical protein
MQGQSQGRGAQIDRIDGPLGARLVTFRRLLFRRGRGRILFRLGEIDFENAFPNVSETYFGNVFPKSFFERVLPQPRRKRRLREVTNKGLLRAFWSGDLAAAYQIAKEKHGGRVQAQFFPPNC